MRYLFAALILLPTTALAQSLTVGGACPGPVDIDADGLTPGGDVVFIMGLGEGSDVIGAGPCLGTVTGLAGLSRGPRFSTPDGTLSFSPTVPDGICGISFQILDLATCTLTNVADFSGGGEPPDGCQGGSDMTAVAPGEDMVLCDDPGDVTCEEDFGALCPVDWHLCSPEEYNNRNDGWAEPLPGVGKALGTIYCRSGDSAAGHFSVSYAGIGSLGEDEPLNCGFGSSRATCESGFGCNEQSSVALCCAPNPSCGNGVVDHAEELCDDGNMDETDDCLNNCSWRNPTANGLGGIGC